MPASNYVNTNSLKAWLQGTVSITFPSTVYVGLFLTNPTSSGTGTEVSGSGYTRATATFGNPSSSGSSMVSSNTASVTFPQATGSWGTPQYFAIYDSLSGGNMLFYGSLPTAYAISSGMTPQFAAGALTVSAT